MSKSPFKLKSGNAPTFKQMGSSPVRQVEGHTAADSTAAYNRAKQRLELEREIDADPAYSLSREGFTGWDNRPRPVKEEWYKGDILKEIWDLRRENVKKGIYVQGGDYAYPELEKTVHTLKPKGKVPYWQKTKGTIKKTATQRAKVELTKMPTIQPKPTKTSSSEPKLIPSYRTDVRGAYKDYGGGTKKGHEKPIIVKYKDGSSERVSQEHYDKNVAPYYKQHPTKKGHSLVIKKNNYARKK